MRNVISIVRRVWRMGLVFNVSQILFWVRGRVRLVFSLVLPVLLLPILAEVVCLVITMSQERILVPSV